MTVNYALNGQYSSSRQRIVNAELSQVLKLAKRQEFDHFYKYRFLYQDESGNIIPIYDKTQNVAGGAGDIILKFYGNAGSGFEFCEVTT